MKNYLLEIYFERTQKYDPLTVWDESHRVVVYAADAETAREMGFTVIQKLLIHGDIALNKNVSVYEL